MGELTRQDHVNDRRPADDQDGPPTTARTDRAISREASSACPGQVKRRAEHGGGTDGFATCSGDVVGGPAVDHQLVAVEGEPAGAVVLGLDRDHPGLAD